MELKVIQILGFARSGTTLLGNMLGELDGFLHVGELRYVWGRALHRKVRCGCKEAVADCPFWSDVLSRTLARFPELSSDSAAVLDPEALGRARAAQRKALARRAWRRRGPEVGDWEGSLYLRLTEALLQSAAAVSGARVVIDSSKLPSSATPLASMGSIVPYYLHVIRDPRGAVLSRQKRRAPWDGDKQRLSPVTATADSLRWLRRNLAGERFAGRRGPGAYLALRYEDFIVHPTASLSRIVEWVGEETGKMPLADERTVVLSQNHTVCGNNNRFETGLVPLRLDETWRKALRERDYWLITLLTGAGLVRYGYPLRRGRAREEAMELTA